MAEGEAVLCFPSCCTPSGGKRKRYPSDSTEMTTQTAESCINNESKIAACPRVEEKEEACLLKDTMVDIYVPKKANVDTSLRKQEKEEACLLKDTTVDIYVTKNATVDTSLREEATADTCLREEESKVDKSTPEEEILYRHMDRSDYEQIEKRLKKGRKKRWNWKYVSFILVFLFMVMILAFFWEFVEIRDIKKEINRQHWERSKIIEDQREATKTLKLTQVKRLSNPSSSTAGFTGIILRGQGQVQKGRRGIAIRGWNNTFQSGNIDFAEHKKIVIRKPGLYNVYAQMFFYQNGKKYKVNVTRNPVMDFGIRKERANERVIADTISMYSCRVACTRRISSIVLLDVDDTLVVDTETPGIYFKMIPEKSIFGAYLISDNAASGFVS